MRARAPDGGGLRDGDRGRAGGGDAGGGFVGPMSAIALGAIAAVPSYFGLIWRSKTSLDDSLDVVAAHGVGGTVGALLTGVFAQKALNGVADGVLFGNPAQLGIQAAAVAATIVYSGVVSFLLLKLIGLVIPLRASADDESVGLDLTNHGEEAYVPGEASATLKILHVGGRPKTYAGPSIGASHENSSKRPFARTKVDDL
jgi:hypothetical protein